MKGLERTKIHALGKNEIKNETESSLFHVVNLKENLLSISQKYKISPNELKKINGLKDDKIYLGQVINLKDKNIIKKNEGLNNEKEIRPKLKKAEVLDKDIIIKPVEFISSPNSPYPYEDFKFRDSYYMDFGFTENLSWDDGLIYCLNAICWIEHHECYETHERGTLKTHFIYVNVFYMNKLGEVIFGKQIHLDFKTQAQKVPNAGAYDYDVKLLTDVNKKIYHYLSKGKKLHEEIFIEKKYKFESGAEFDISEQNKAYIILKNASIVNRVGDTNCIYTAVEKKKEEIENVLDWISIAAVPFEIPLKFMKPVQMLLEFIAYSSDVDSKTKFLDKLFNFRGPFPLSPIYHRFYAKQDIYDPSGNPVGGYKQIQQGKTMVYKEDFIMDEILTILQNDIIKKKPL